VIRFAVRYGNLNTLEEGYGINLVPLATFAMETYKNVDCSRFRIRYNTEYDTGDLDLDMMMHKAITIIMLKLEGQLIKRNPDFKMDKRLLFECVDWEKKTVTVDGKTYDMLDTDFPTVDPADPYKLTDEEEAVVKKLRHAFRHSEKLQKHVRFLYSKGSLYRIHDGNLIYHGCVPLDPDGSFMNVNVCGTEYHGRKLYDVLESYARKAYYLTDDPVEKKKGQDILYYIWAGPCSPVFGKAKMATFESYFIADKEASVETKNSYYDLYEKEEVVDSIINEFGLDTSSAHIINGHVPVEVKKGDTPLKCGGKLLIIDGGFAKAYQSKTGIAGYTLIVNSHGMWLSALEPFESKEAAIHDETDIVSESILVEQYSRRHFVADSDKGREIRKNIADLEDLLEAYRDGVIIEKEK
jgi:fructose-1,6-bisphosphatase-3